MHEKDIKQQTVKQLKKNFPRWKHLTKKEKKKLARYVLNEVVRTYEFNKDITEPLHAHTSSLPFLPCRTLTGSKIRVHRNNTTTLLCEDVPGEAKNHYSCTCAMLAGDDKMRLRVVKGYMKGVNLWRKKTFKKTFKEVFYTFCSGG